MLSENEGSSRFYLYRYQILPINRTPGVGLFGDETSVANLIARKNEIFSSRLQEAQRLLSRRTRVRHEIAFQEDDFFLVRLAANRKIHRETEDFGVEDIDNWPSIFLAIWNLPDKQLIAVQRRTAAFSYPATPAKILEETLNLGLEKQGLRLHVEPMFEESAFWSLVEEHRTRIKRLVFELVTPNMANISGEVSDSLKLLAKSTNTAKTELALDADPNAVLDVNKGNPQIRGLVDYASNGGGDVAIKVKGLKKTLRAQKSVREVEVDGLSIRGSAESVAKVIKSLMDDL